MSKHPDTNPTASHLEVTPPPPPHRKSENERPGAAIFNSDDPSTEALRCWAQDKQKHYPGQDGSFAQGGNTAGVVDGMAWGGPWLLPHKGDTLPPPDHGVVHGEARVVGGGDGERDDGEREGGEVKRGRGLMGLLGRGRSGGRDGGRKGSGDEGAR